VRDLLKYNRPDASFILNLSPGLENPWGQAIKKIIQNLQNKEVWLSVCDSYLLASLALSDISYNKVIADCAGATFAVSLDNRILCNPLSMMICK
jgi:hypothetical protein